MYLVLVDAMDRSLKSKNTKDRMHHQTEIGGVGSDITFFGIFQVHT